MTVMRRLVAALLHHAVSTLPPTRRPWGDAMLAEFDHIPGDAEALRWTLGAVRTAGRLRREAISGATRVPTGVRWALAALFLAPLAGALTLLGWEVDGALTATPDPNSFQGLGIIVAAILAVPAGLTVAGFFGLMAVRWRRVAGTPPSRLAYRAAVLAEALTVAAMVALWIGSFTLTFSSGGIDGMSTLVAVLIVVVNTAMASIGWVIVLILSDVLRRLLRIRAAVPGPA
jgi:hypothetical protein